jgi:hypothetical protein
MMAAVGEVAGWDRRVKGARVEFMLGREDDPAEV